MKISETDYAEISIKLDSSAANSAYTNGNRSNMSDTVWELIKDIENFNLNRNKKMNKMYYDSKKEILRPKLRINPQISLEMKSL